MAFSAESALEFLEKARDAGRLGHAYLVSGGDRRGRQELALGLIRLVDAGCTAGDLDEAASAGVMVARPGSKSRRIRIEAVRELEKRLHLGSGKRGRFVVIEEADRLQEQAGNAFLKTLEEPPDGSLLMLLTSQPERLLETIRSRCIRIPLMAPGGMGAGRGDEEGAEDIGELLGLLQHHAVGTGSGLGGAFVVKQAFADLLDRVKTRLEREAGAECKEEAARYRQTTEGDWLARREAHYEALGRSRYLERRGELIGVLSSWFGDALRQAVGSPGLDLPGHRDSTARLAAAWPPDRLIEAVEAVDFIRRHLETNVHEALALEVGFLRLLTGRGVA